MISNKVVIILMVIFDMICCDIQMDECEKILKEIGLASKSGFYNLNLLLKFANFEKFVDHVTTRIHIANNNNVPKPPKPGKENPTFNTFEEASTSREPKRQKTDDGILPNIYYDYFRRFYINVSKARGFDTFRNPIEYCTIIVRTHLQNELPEADRKQLHDRLIFMIKNGRGTPDPMKERHKFLEKMDRVIKKCEELILNYNFVFQNKVYKYDKNNVHINVLISIQLALLNDNDQKSIDLKMKAYDDGLRLLFIDINNADNHFLEISTNTYFNYLMTIFMDNFKNFPELTINEICRSIVFNTERLNKSIDNINKKPWPIPIMVK